MLVYETAEDMFFFLFRLVTAILFPVAIAVIFYCLDKKTKFGKIGYWKKQTIIGVIFGGVAILATEFGIPVDSAVLNVRSAAPLSAGLIFGGPAGIIAGTIGAIHRWFSVYWGIGAYTRLACTLATFFAGIIAALCREFVFNNKKTTWLYGFIIGVTTEVIHMLIVFFTNSDDLHQAFLVILKCAVPMIISNGISVMLAMFLITAIGRGKIRNTEKSENTITYAFQSALLICVLLAFFITSGFTTVLQGRIAKEEIHNLLKLNVNVIPEAIDDVSISTLLQYNTWMAQKIDAADTGDEEFYVALQEEYEVLEMYVVDEKGNIVYTNFKDMIGTNYIDYVHLQEFDVICEENEYIRPFEPSFHDANVWMRYCGTKLEDGGMIIVGYDVSFLMEEIKQHITTIAKNRYIGETGYVMIADEKGNILCSGHESDISNIQEYGMSLEDVAENTVFEAKLLDEDAFCMYIVESNVEGTYYFIAVYPETEALFSQRSAVYLGIFMEILVFAVLFTQIYFLIKKRIIKNIHDINDSLEHITNGNLDIKVEVRENKEFASLSDDINNLVSAMKRYIEEAASRIDKELAFAKAIQISSLPSVFPEKKELDIYALMRAAKEVGGDFYDFYLLDDNHIAFVMADVSGKGIPAAMFMMTAKSIIKGYAERGFEVNEIFECTNNELCEGNDAEMFVTAWMGILDLQSGVLTYGNAGHNPPLLRRKDGTFEYLRNKANLALAFMDGVTYQKYEIQLSKGDALYLYTDGVTEATNADVVLYGEKRLQKKLNEVMDDSAEKRCNRILADIDEFVGKAEQFDDITMLSVNFYGENNEK